jgi:hypothetical protein
MLKIEKPMPQILNAPVNDKARNPALNVGIGENSFFILGQLAFRLLFKRARMIIFCYAEDREVIKPLPLISVWQVHRREIF